MFVTISCAHINVGMRSINDAIGQTVHISTVSTVKLPDTYTFDVDVSGWS